MVNSRPLTGSQSGSGSRLFAGAGLFALLGAFVAFQGCSQGSAGDPNNPGAFQLNLMTTGVQQVYPYRIAKLDSFGNPTTEIINISTMDDLKDNARTNNGVLPLGTFGLTAQLPNGSPGNQFLQFTFSHDLKIESILSDLPANQTNSGLTNNIQILSYDPTNENTQVVTGRGFVGGYTYYDDPGTPGLDLKLVRAVGADDQGNVNILDPRANGFPRGFSGDEILVSSKTFVFIPDADQDLTTFETYPTSRVIRIIVSSSVLDLREKPLTVEVCTGTTVGPDSTQPEILGVISASKPLQIDPGSGAINVSPTTSIRASFSKPVQPVSVGEFDSTTNKTPAFRGVTLNATINSQVVPILYYADPFGPGDLCNYTIKPAFMLPSTTLHNIAIETSIDSLVSGVKLGTQAATTFTTGKGPGVINAPVAPEAIYVGRAGTGAGLSVIDLDGNGQGTGDFSKFTDANYKFGFKRNPNLSNSGVIPPLNPGTQNMDAGSAGVMTLTEDTNKSDLLLDSSVVGRVDDIEIGAPLDLIFNNENVNVHVTRANQQNPLTGAIQPGNTISLPPTPNPPKLTFAPTFTNPAYNIFAEEPTVSSIAPSPPCTVSSMNLLVQGNPMASLNSSYGLFYVAAPGTFYGPQPRPPASSSASPLPCPYNSRQQIGHFLYVLDGANQQVLVLNSNRMQVLETLQVRGASRISMSPNLKRLAITNFVAGIVSFVDTDPLSTKFHKVIGQTKVGSGASEMAWEPEGEDLLVLNRRANSVSIINGADLTLRKTVSSRINDPIDIVVTARQQGIGWQTGVYFAYILNRNGSIAIFESGPDGINGIGFDDIIGLPEEAKFKQATAIQPDIRSFNSSIWVAHKDSSGLGQVSLLELFSSPLGPLPIQQNNGGIIQSPTFRQREWRVTGRIGGQSPTTPIKDRLSGKDPIDIVVDEMQNVGAYVDMTSLSVSNIIYAQHSGKTHVKVTPNGALVPAINPRFLFVALADKGVIDVMEVDTGRKLFTIKAPGVQVLSSYWKQ